MASEGLFPQLIVIPLHRDHGVITMAAGKNDVIKLLPPLTLSEAEARSFLGALDAVLADCHGAASKNWGVVRDIATATLRSRPRARRGRRRPTAPFRGKPIDPSRDHVCLVTGATGFIGGHLAQRLVEEGYQVRCLVRASSDTSLLDKLDVEIAVGDLDERALARRAPRRAAATCSTAARWCRTGPRRGDRRASTSRARGTCSRPPLDASVERFVHFSTTDVYGYPGGAAIDETYAATRFRNWYAQTKLDAEAEVRRVERRTRWTP